MIRIPDEKFPAIVDAVCYWLGYQFKIGREQLIHEASLRYPIADTITSKGTAINRIVLEKLHPLFKSKKIDLVIYDNSVKEEDFDKDTKLQEVYEFKLAKNDTGKEHSDEHQRVFDDVIRLAYYHLWSQKDCYFLMCGKYSDFKNYFIGQMKPPNTKVAEVVGVSKELSEWKPIGLYKDWFGFALNEQKTKLFKDEGKDKWGLSSFKKNYDVRDDIGRQLLNSITLKTTCIGITPPGLERVRTHAAAIWKIEGIAESK